LVFAVGALLSGPGCRADPPSPSSWPPSALQLEGEIFASRWRVVLPERGDDDEAVIRGAVGDALAATDAGLSLWRPDSALLRCHAVPAGAPCALDGLTAAAVRAALRVEAATDGAFGVALEPLLALWGLTASTKGRAAPLPGPAAIAAALARIEPGGVALQGDALVRRRDDVRLDLTAVTDGAAAAAVAAALRARGHRDFLVDVAGEVVVAGRAGHDHLGGPGRTHGAAGRPWRVAIEDPRAAPDTPLRQAELAPPPGRTWALSTSGTTRATRTVGGRTVTHVLDPRVGEPVDGELVSCTITGPDVVVVDALSTACLVLGRTATAAVLARFEGTRGLYVFADGHVVADEGFPRLPAPG